MSDEANTPGGAEEGFVDLTSLDFGPAWARKPAKGKTGEPKREEGPKRERRERDDKRQRGDKRGGGERRGRDDQRGGGGQRDRRDGKRGDGRRFGKGGHRGRRDDDRRDRGPRREEVPPPEGVTASVMPVEEGLDRLAKEIMGGGRTYSVFDLSKLVMGARDRFNVNFKVPGGRKLIRCRKDGSLWLDQSEALRHLWRADWLGDYYEEVATEVDPPRGNFQAVAKCGISGELLGPPNYHGYQASIATLHRERFRHMSLDNYKRKIEMDRSEEAVNAWLETMSKRIRYRPTGGVPRAKAEPVEEEAKEESPAGEAPAEASAAEESSGGSGDDAGTAPDSEAAAGAPEAESEGEGGGDERAAEEAANEEAPGDESAPEEPAPVEAAAPGPAAESGPLLADKKEVEKHFLENHYRELFQETDRAWVPGNIPGNRLSPGLLTLLRHTVAEERRYPGKLTPMLCRQLSGRHVAVFKWRKKLKAGPSRPHVIPSDISIADRPQTLLEWVKAKSGSSLAQLWKDLLPSEADDKTKHEWYHDLHWLLNQGYALLLGDSTIHLAKREGGGPQGKAPPKAGEGKKAKRRKRGRRRKRVKGRPGLYAWSSMTMAGEPKLQRALTASGLWPLESRMDVAGEAIPAEEEDEGIPRRVWPVLG